MTKSNVRSKNPLVLALLLSILFCSSSVSAMDEEYSESSNRSYSVSSSSSYSDYTDEESSSSYSYSSSSSSDSSDGEEDEHNNKIRTVLKLGAAAALTTGATILKWCVQNLIG